MQPRKGLFKYMTAINGVLRHIIKIVMLVFVLTSCLPQNESLDQSLLDTIGKDKKGDDSFSNFSGITSAETVSSTKVKLNWNEATDATIVAYNIYDTTLLFSPKLVKTVKAPATSVTMTNLTTQAYYSFRARAVNAEGKEDSNVIDKGAIPYGGVISSQVITSTTAKLVINSASDADAVNVYCKEGIAAVTESLLARITNTATTEITLSDLTQGIQYTCRVVLDVGGFEDNNQVTTSFIPLGTASQLVFTTQPSNGTAGVDLSAQPVIAIKDSNGNTITAGPDSAALVTLTIASNSPSTGVIRGTAAVNAVNGVATFAGLNIREAGIKIMNASKEDKSTEVNGAGVLTSDSNNFTITAGAVDASKSTIAITPSVPPANPLAADGSAAYSVVFTLKDQYQNPITGVKPQFATTILGDTLVQPTVNTDANGQTTGSISTVVADEVAPFRNLTISSPSGLNSVAASAPFVAGTATKLSFTVQPVNSPAGLNGVATVKVAVQDTNGNIVRTGADSMSSITMTIASNVNGAILTGTATQSAVNGIATFTGLGIDRTGTGYKLLASSGGLIPAYSNAFNVTAGVPNKIVISGASSVRSGLCSTAITVQLQDNGNNPANAIQNTPLAITGLSGAALYTSSACSGSPMSSTLTFTAGTNTKTVYLKNNTNETITLTIRDSSNVLTQGTRVIDITPSKIALSALMPSPPAPANTPLTVVAGVCSQALKILPAGENSVTGPIATSSTIVAITGLNGSSAKIYSDSSCTQEIVDPLQVPLPVTLGGTYPISIYLKDNKAETLNLNVSDPNGVMTTTSLSQVVNITASNISFTGPTSVVAGQCSTAYTVTLKDVQNNSVSAAANTTLNINGLSGSTTGKFYTSPSCTGAPYTTSITIPQAASSMVLYFSDTTAEALNIYFSDPAGGMANSPTISIGISPAALKITGPSPANSNTTVCAGPFTINTLDGATPTPNVTAAISTINVNLTTSGFPAGFASAGKFYGNSTCTSQISSVVFSAGHSAKTFYFVGQYPQANITLSATDAGAILTTGTMTWTINAAKGWLGTLGKITDALGDLIWFRTGVKNVSARIDAPSSIYDLTFDASKRFLYVVDHSLARILKYDYTNRKYLGWIGRFENPMNATTPITGSKYDSGSSDPAYNQLPSPAACVSKVHGDITPGWCLGGQSWHEGSGTVGGLHWPTAVAADDDYIYVTSRSNHIVNRYNANSGAFAGWIGRITGTPTGTGAGNPQNCTSFSSGQTPGWCIGGSRNAYLSGDSNWNYGNGNLWDPYAITVDANYIYVATIGAVQRYDKVTGAHAGWIGKAYNQSLPASDGAGATGCAAMTSGQTTPGWCVGGSHYRALNQTEMSNGALYQPRDLYIHGGILYVLENVWSGYINKYNVATGAFIETMPSLAHNNLGLLSMIKDATSSNFIMADASRVIATDNTGLLVGWMGKINLNTGMSAGLSNTNVCSGLAVNENTPGWCLGGNAKAGIDETAFNDAYAIEQDADGHILVGQYRNPAIKKFNVSTGEYLGSLIYSSEAPVEWTNNANIVAERFGYGDDDFYNPGGSYSDGTHLYVADTANGRVKKIELATGKLIGWVGAVTSRPTSGTSSACTSANPMSTVDAWCTGAYSNPWIVFGLNFTNNDKLDGLMHSPLNIAGDGTHIYVTDAGLHRILKFNASTGAFVGWIGRVSQIPTGGATNCSSTSTGFTPGWCTGGTSQAGSADGEMNYPSAITYIAATGNIYVVDSNNQRVSSYNATTGAFNGWIGRTNAAPSTGCTPSTNGQYTVSMTGWCKGGTAQAANSYNDRGGGFSFYTSDNYAPNGITTDGSSLYIANPWNQRIDKFNFSGEWQASVKTRMDQYTNVWVTDRNTLQSWSGATNGSIRGIWTDGVHMYGLPYQNYLSDWGYSGDAVFKMNLSTGSMVGWQGGIRPNGAPSDGDVPACAGADTTTPGWCMHGRSLPNYKLGQFGDARHVSGDGKYIYITDLSTHRVTRLPK